MTVPLLKKIWAPSTFCETRTSASLFVPSLLYPSHANADFVSQRAVAAIPRIQELNPRVTVKSGGSLQNLLLQNQNYYTPFDVVIACDLDFNTTCNINDACHLAGRPFYAAGIHGFYGYVFVDLKAHEFVVEREKSNKPTQLGPESETRSILAVTDKPDVPSNGKKMEMVKKQERYCPLRLANTSPLPADTLANRRKLKSVPPLLPCLRALFDFQSAYSRLPTHTTQDLGVFATLVNLKSQELTVPPLSADSLRSFLHNLGAEIVPTAAFVGGRLSEDVINVLGKREQPIQNFALFDGDAMDGRIYCLYTKPPELLVGPELMAMGMGGMPMQVDLGGANVGNGVGMALGGTGVNGDVGYGVPMEVVGGAPAGAENASVGNGVDGEVAGSGADAAAAPSIAATISAPTSAPANETGVTNDA